MANRNAKGREPKVTPELIDAFGRILGEHPKWKFTEVYREAVPVFKRIVKKDLREQHPDWSDDLLSEEIDEKIPGESAVRKWWNKLETGTDKSNHFLKRFESDPKNKSWNMGVLVDQDLPASALSVLLEIQEERQQKSKPPLTIREAWWAAHLCEIVRATQVYPRIQVVDVWAKRYASEHRFRDMLKQPLDTTKLDKFFPKYAEAYAMFSLFWDVVQEEKGFEATSELFSSLLEQKAIVHGLDKLTFADNLSSREFANQKRQLGEINKAQEEERRIWDIVTAITDKAELGELESSKLEMSSDPKFKTFMQTQHGPHIEQEFEKRIEEVKKRISEREAEKNERASVQEKRERQNLDNQDKPGV